MLLRLSVSARMIKPTNRRGKKKLGGWSGFVVVPAVARGGATGAGAAAGEAAGNKGMPTGVERGSGGGAIRADVAETETAVWPASGNPIVEDVVVMGTTAARAVIAGAAPGTTEAAAVLAPHARGWGWTIWPGWGFVMGTAGSGKRGE